MQKFRKVYSISYVHTLPNFSNYLNLDWIQTTFTYLIVYCKTGFFNPFFISNCNVSQNQCLKKNLLVNIDKITITKTFY